MSNTSNQAKIGNLYATPTPPQGEHFETLFEHLNTRLEVITSADATHSTRYVQTQDEWVVLLAGEASLNINGEVIALRAGDYVFLAAGLPHQVMHTSQGARWLALHYTAKSEGAAHR